MTMPIRSLVVCATCADLDNPVTGSTKTLCAECRIPVWVSPDILSHDTARDAETICIECAMRILMEEDVSKCKFTYL